MDRSARTRDRSDRARGGGAKFLAFGASSPSILRPCVNEVGFSYRRLTSETTAVGCVRICTDHEQTGKAVILQHDLMNDAAAGLPKAQTEFLRRRR